MESVRLLLAEDDLLLGDGLCAALADTGYSVDWTKDGQAADAALRARSYDAVLLDLNLPGRSGLEVLIALRTRGSSVPVLVITARDAVGDRVRALDGGADDYLIKPFDLDELGARLRALQRRASGRVAPLLRHGPLVLDPAARTVTLDGRRIALAPREFAVLQALMENRGRVLSRRRLEDVLYGWTDEVESNAVEVHVHHLRRKLGINPIRTVRGVGYMIERGK